MANPGAGNKFVSVNLNRSYGKPSSLSGGRARPSGHGVGGMVVLSRARSGVSSAQKGARLSVPPPLNLPSLRKEHEKIDSSSGTTVGTSSGTGLGSGSSVVGWTKPHTSRVDESEAKIATIAPSVSSVSVGEDAGARARVYTPPGARGAGAEPPVPTVQKAVLLGGEDFPSLQASLPVSQSPVPQRQKQKFSDIEKKESGSKLSDGMLDSPLPLHMRPQTKPRSNDVDEKDGLVVSSERTRKDAEILSGPLPMVRLGHSDWADDERDTSYRPERDRDRFHSRNEMEMKLDAPRSTLSLPGNGGAFDTPSFQKGSSVNVLNSDSGRESAFLDAGRVALRDAYGRQLPGNRNGRDENSWRGLPVRKDGYGARDVGLKQNGGGGIRPTSFNKVNTADHKFERVTYPTNSSAKEDAWDGPAVSANRPQQVSYAQISQKGNIFMEMVGGKSKEQSSVSQQGNPSNWTKGHIGAAQNGMTSRSLFSLGAKGLAVNDPILLFGKDKRSSFSRNGKPYVEDGFMEDFSSPTFDGRDPFAPDMRLIKKKKDLSKNAVFYDPDRESFEAQLERVQKMQELERQKMLEEHTRAVELARKEVEERERVAREEDERRRRLEEEAREAARRVERERLEAAQRAEELKRAREEEKRRMHLEEERRKDAAKQKLLELEARMAQREAESSGWMRPFGDSMHCPLKDREHSTTVEGTQCEGYANTLNRLTAERSFTKREFHGGPGYMSSRGNVSPHDILVNNDDSQRIALHRWSSSMDVRSSRKLDMDGEFTENSLNRFGDPGWRQDGSRVSSHVLDSEILFQNSEIDGLSSGRSQHSVRQARVLPPPPLTSVSRSSSRVNVRGSKSSSIVEDESDHQHSLCKDLEFRASDDRVNHHQNHKQSDSVSVPHKSQIQNGDEGELGCDSQSSLSVSSMPNSPTHLSHDDVDDSADSNALLADYEQVVVSDSENVMRPEKENKVSAGLCALVSPGEEEDWPVEENAGLREQEEYDEVEDAYQEDDEVHEGDEENFDLAKDFRDLHLEQQVQTPGLQPDLDLDNVVDVNPIEGNAFVETVVGWHQRVETLDSQPGTSQSSDMGVVQHTDENNPPSNLSEPNLPVSIEENAKAQELVPQPMNTSSVQVSPNACADGNIESSKSSLSVKHIHTPVIGASSCQQVPPVVGGVSSVSRQAELNVPMQFGLFSGPTLMPSPLPAIQIGSIQMPLHLHPQVGQPLTQLHHSQASMFQFGQMGYPSPLAQGILPKPQTLSFVQPAIPSHYSINQQPPTVSLRSQSGKEPPYNLHLTEKATTNFAEYNQRLGTKLGDPRQEKSTKESTSLPMTHAIGSVGEKVPSYNNSFFSADCARSEFMTHAGDMIDKDSKTKESPMANNRDSQNRIVGEAISSNTYPGKRVGNRGGRVVYSVRNAGPERPSLASEGSHVGAVNNFRRKGQRVVQRTEFRVRETFDKKEADISDSYGYSGKEMAIPIVTIDSTTSKGGGRKDFGVHKDTRQPLRPESGSSFYTSNHATKYEGRTNRTLVSKLPTKRQTSLQKDQCFPCRNLKRNIVPEEDVETSLQSGVVHIFNQPGIEAPSDEDDFIQVRSKRQMLNDRREQREKEIKAKSKAAEGLRRPRGLPKTSFNNTHVSLAADGGSLASNVTHREITIPDGRLPNQTINEAPSAFSSTVPSQSLPPIGTPAVNFDVQADNRPPSVKALHDSSYSAVLGHGQRLVPDLSFENNPSIVDNVSSSLGSWDNAHHNLNIPLTQTQLDEVVKPANFDAQFSPPLGDHSGLVKDASRVSKLQDKPFSASANSLNSLLAGEKIQFGAVTSPTVLLPGSCAAAPMAVGPVVSCISNTPVEHKLPAPEGDCMPFFDKVKHSEGSRLEDPEAEAEAAASAIAVAAISNDEHVGNDLASCPLSVTDMKSYGEVDPAMPAEAGTVPVSSQVKSEEPFSISLPADLSVETPAHSLWSPLTNSQSSSSTMLSHFQGIPHHSHFPCFEVNPMLGSPVFALGSHEESANGQLQSLKNNVPGSGSLGAWPHHSQMDSFYGPPAGLTGPFVGPPGAIPGIQGPPHMFVYNHFAPVGQYGQMGLRLMGTAYIPSGKQPDWKHIPVSSATTGRPNDNLSNLNLVAGQCEPNIHMSIQHLLRGSPLLPITPPLGMFDISPFQPSPDLSAQAHWSHVPAPSLHSLPLSTGASVPSQQAEVPSQQFNHASTESSGIRFGEGLPLKPADCGRTFITNHAASQFPDELGLHEALSGNSSLPISTDGPSSYITSDTKAQSVSKISSTTSGKVGAVNGGGNGDTVGCGTARGNQTSSSTFVSHGLQAQNSSPYLNQVGYAEQRDRSIPQKVGSAGEWPPKHGFSARNHTGEKNFNTSKTKQIYVAKPSSSGGASI